ncbi:hypothetical protein ACFXA6_55235, partial [Streptomyces mirabilis]
MVRENLRLITPDRGTAHAAALLEQVPGVRSVVAADGRVTVTDLGHAIARAHDYRTGDGQIHHAEGQFQNLRRNQDPATATEQPLSFERAGALFPSPAWDQTLTEALRSPQMLARAGLPVDAQRVPAGLALGHPEHPAFAFRPAELSPDPARATLAIPGDAPAAAKATVAVTEGQSARGQDVRRNIETTVRALASAPATGSLRLAWDLAAHTKDAQAFLQQLANDHNVTLIAPNNRIEVLHGGETRITGPNGQWLRFDPHAQQPEQTGALFPPPAWQHAADAATHTDGLLPDGGQIRRIPAGLWLDTTNPAAPGGYPGMPTPQTAHALLPHRDAPTILVTADPTHPTTRTTLDHLLNRLATTPDRPATVNLILSHPTADTLLLTHPANGTPDPVAAELQHLADTHHLTLTIAEGAFTPTTHGTLRPTTRETTGNTPDTTPTWRQYHGTPPPTTDHPATNNPTPKNPEPKEPASQSMTRSDSLATLTEPHPATPPTDPAPASAAPHLRPGPEAAPPRTAVGTPLPNALTPHPQTSERLTVPDTPAHTPRPDAGRPPVATRERNLEPHPLSAPGNENPTTPQTTTQKPQGTTTPAATEALNPQQPSDHTAHDSHQPTPPASDQSSTAPDATALANTPSPNRAALSFSDVFPHMEATPQLQAAFNLLTTTAAQHLNHTPTVDDLHTYAEKVLTAHDTNTTTRPPLHTVMDTLTDLPADHREIYLNTAGQPPIDKINNALGKLTVPAHNTLITQASTLIHLPLTIDPNTDTTTAHSLRHDTIQRITHALLPQDGQTPEQAETKATNLAKHLGINRTSGLSGAGWDSNGNWTPEDHYGNAIAFSAATEPSPSGTYTSWRRSNAPSPEPDSYAPQPDTSGRATIREVAEKYGINIRTLRTRAGLVDLEHDGGPYSGTYDRAALEKLAQQPVRRLHQRDPETEAQELWREYGEAAGKLTHHDASAALGGGDSNRMKKVLDRVRELVAEQAREEREERRHHVWGTPGPGDSGDESAADSSHNDAAHTHYSSRYGGDHSTWWSTSAPPRTTATDNGSTVAGTAPATTAPDPHLVHPELWEQRRADAPVTRIDTEHFEPA